MDVAMSSRKGIKLSAQKSCKVNQSFQRQVYIYWPEIKRNEDNEPTQSSADQHAFVHVQGP